MLAPTIQNDSNMENNTNNNYLKKELYELIKKDESIFDFIQESSLDGMWYWDLENPENEWMNARFWTTLGYNPEEMPHKSSAWQDIINQNDLKIALVNFTKHCENPNHAYDQVVRYKHKNGSNVWIRCRGLAIRNKKNIPIRMLGAHHDITELKNTEQELIFAKQKVEESEKRLIQAQQIAKIGHWELDVETNKLTWSDEIYRIFNLKPQEFEATYEAFLNNIHPEDRKSVDEAYTNSLKTKLPYEIEHRLLLKSGKIKYVSEKCTTEYDKSGHPLRSFGTVLDITIQKEKELALIESELKLKESNTTKDKFFSIISHDLKSPFNSLLGFTDMLVENYDLFDDEERKSIIDSLNTSSKNTYQLLENLLTWSRSQTGIIEFVQEEIEIKLVIKESILLCQAAAENKNIELIESAEDGLMVFADKNMLHTVLRNLISNAIKFTENKGTLIVSAKESKQEGFIEISVSDTGVGIPEDIIDDLFLMDKDVSTPGTENEKGTGLGLILCKEFVEKQGGKIWVESEVGVGSQFIFTLPAVLIENPVS